jgi:hypothetical protein
MGSYKGSLHTYVTTLFVTFGENSSLDDKQVELGKFTIVTLISSSHNARLSMTTTRGLPYMSILFYIFTPNLKSK